MSKRWLGIARTGHVFPKEYRVTRHKKDLEIDNRARKLIEDQLGDRGRFTALESMSGISVNQWKNFFYGKQSLNDQMLAFLRKKYPDEEQWLLTGLPSPDQKSFPFLAPVPKATDYMTVGARLNWVIREFASPRGDGLFSYLSSKRVINSTHPSIAPEEWKEVVLGLKEPSAAMIAVVCEMRPLFTSWVLLGHDAGPQVDPTNKASIERWKSGDTFEARIKRGGSKLVTRKTPARPPKDVQLEAPAKSRAKIDGHKEK